MTDQPQQRTHATVPTPIFISRRTGTILLISGIVVLLALFWIAPILLNLLLGGATLALVLSYPVGMLSRVMPRKLAILVVFLTLLIVIMAALIVLVPLLVNELTDLVSAAPELSDDTENLFRDLLQTLYDRGILPSEPDEVIAQFRQGLFDRAQEVATALLSAMIDALSSIVGIAIQIFGIFFVAIYLLVDIRRFKKAYMRMVPRQYWRDAHELWVAIGQSLSRYLAGLLVSLAIQGALAALALWVIGIPYALLLGIWMSATAIIPYVGAFLGAIPAVILAFFISPGTAVLTVLTYLLINQIEANLLTPRIQGQAVRVHPLLVFLAVIAGSEIAGVKGAVFAVPTLAVARVLVDFFQARLRISTPVAAEAASGASEDPVPPEAPEP